MHNAILNAQLCLIQQAGGAFSSKNWCTAARKSAFQK